MAEVIRYVDTDASGSGTGVDWTNAYTSLSAWENAEQTNLVTAGDWHHVYCRASSGTADTTSLAINGWVTSPIFNILIEAAEGDQADKTGYDTARYRLDTNTTTGLYIPVSNVELRGLQLGAGASTTQIIVASSVSNIIIRNCYLNCVSAATGIDGSGTGAEVTFINSVFFNGGSQGAGSEGIYAHTGAGNDFKIFNCIVYNFNDGVERDNGSLEITNSAVFNNNNDFDGTMTIDACASDDGDGTNPVAPSGSDWTNEFVDPANGDFTLLNSGNLYHGGSTAPDSSLYTTDIEGDAYNVAAYSIGVDEYVAAGGGLSIPVAMHHYRQLRN